MERRLLSILSAAALLICACVPNSDIHEGSEGGFHAVMEPQQNTSRTSISGGKVLWSEGDQIAVYLADEAEGKVGAIFTLDPADAGEAHGRFDSPDHSDWGAKTCYALYPASMDGGFNANHLTVNLPAEQLYCDDSFGPEASPAVGICKGDHTLSFKNLCGILSVNVFAYERISSVQITTLGEEALWGEGSLLMPFDGTPVLEMKPMVSEEQKTLTIRVNENPTEGQVIKPGSTIDIYDDLFSGEGSYVRAFNFVVPAGTLAQGFLVTVNTTDRKYMQKYAIASSANMIARSVITDMPILDFYDQSEVVIRDDVPNKAYYKDLLIDTGIGLSDYKTLSCTDRLGLSFETVYTRINDAANQAAQNKAFITNENDENGILLYPDGEPRFRMMYVNGGQSYTHGPSLMAGGRANFRKFVYNGGSYLGSCAGSYVASLGVIEAGTTTSNAAMQAYNGYMGLWPGLVDNTGLTNVFPDYTIPSNSPILQYDDFGGDFRIDAIKQWNGPYFSQFYLVQGTEALALFDYPSYRCHNCPSVISYKPSSWCGRITLIGGHPEQYPNDSFPPSEGAQLMDALVKYSLDGRGAAKVKAVLHNGEIRQMIKSTHDNDPAYTKVGDLQCHNFVFGLPVGAKNIRIKLKVLDDFNVSLRLAKGTFAFSDDALYSVENSDREKELVFDSLEAGTWYIGVQCEDTVTNNHDSTYGISYSGKLAVLNGVPYTISVSWE